MLSRVLIAMNLNPGPDLPTALLIRNLRLGLTALGGASDRSIDAQIETLELERTRLLRPPARPPRSERPRCGARTRAGGSCAAPVVWPKGGRPRARCRMHGGLSTGPRTAEGRERIAESNRRRAAARRAELGLDAENPDAPCAAEQRFHPLDVDHGDQRMGAERRQNPRRFAGACGRRTARYPSTPRDGRGG